MLKPMTQTNIYYRPIWTCGRYNKKTQAAIYYNLIAGMSYFFESYSAMVIGEILSVPRNSEFSLDVIASKLLISLSLLSKISDCRQLAMSSPWSRCDVLSFKQRSHRGLRNAQIRTFAVPEVWFYPQKDFYAFWTRFWVFVEAYTLARPSVHICIVIFQTYGHWACPCATFLQYREAHYPFRFSSDGELIT